MTARKWFNCLQQASLHSELYEKERFYNFPNSVYASTDSIIAELGSTIERINSLCGNIITERLDPANAQESVNQLHLHFADSHLVEEKVTEQNIDLWNDFNNLLHAYEAAERSESKKSSPDHPNASIVFTFENNFVEDIEEEDFEHFTIAKEFGTCYVNYCQVGRHFWELFLAQDDLAEEEHIRPLEFISADTYVWLGPNSGKTDIQKKLVKFEKWFHEHSDQFSSLGFNWGDKNLAVGWLPVADLITEDHSEETNSSLLKSLSFYNRIKGVSTSGTDHE